MRRSRASQVHLAQRLSSSFRPGCTLVRPGRALPALLFVALALASGPAEAARTRQIDWLGRARQLYNQAQYEEAIAAAQNVMKVPALADRARLIIGRAHLERFRQSANVPDLVAGRTALDAVSAAALSSGERRELLIGLGEALYLDNSFGAASEIFSSVLGPDAVSDSRDTVLDWWATSLDRMAALRAPDDREAIYARIVDKMDDELQRNPGSASAAYWLAAASRSAGDLDRAWTAAVAGWVRARLAPAQGTSLREDLDHLVETAIIPERAREMAEPGPDREKAIAALQAEWEAVKENWK